MEFGVSTLDSISVLKLKDLQISMQLRGVQNRDKNHGKFHVKTLVIYRIIDRLSEYPIFAWRM
jgi:hypothetical protein